MADEKHESKRSCYSRHKWLLAAAAILLLVFLAAGFSVRYISFVSQTIYQESTSHLEEVLYKSNSMLKEMVRKNLTYLHLYNGFLKSTSNEDEIQAYIEEAQQATGFVDFYFLSYDGNYTTVTGGTGTFEYAATDGTGFSSTPSFANGKLTLVKWTGEATADTLDFRIGGQKAGVAAMAFSVVPEPASASMGLLGLAAMLVRRRRA